MAKPQSIIEAIFQFRLHMKAITGEENPITSIGLDYKVANQLSFESHEMSRFAVGRQDGKFEVCGIPIRKGND